MDILVMLTPVMHHTTPLGIWPVIADGMTILPFFLRLSPFSSIGYEVCGTRKNRPCSLTEREMVGFIHRKK